LASPAKYASNNHGVGNKPSRINFDAPGSVTSKTYHGISIVVDGNIIGRIQTWAPQMYSREGEWVYELNHLTFGRPVDYVPGINSNYTVNCSRVEVWNEELEKALGYPSVWADLIDQDRPFTVQEFLFRGSQVNKVWTYTGCWFKEKNIEQFQAKETPQVMVTATLAFVSRIETQGG
jgi:hypothetical protein